MDKKLIIGIGVLVLLAGLAGFQVNDRDINLSKVKNLVVPNQESPDLQISTESKVMGTLFDMEKNQYLIYENCTIEANQSYRIDRENYNVYDAEDNILCLLKEIKLNSKGG